MCVYSHVKVVLYMQLYLKGNDRVSSKHDSLQCPPTKAHRPHEGRSLEHSVPATRHHCACQNLTLLGYYDNHVGANITLSD